MGAVGALSGGFDIFLWRLTTPLGVGFLIIVVTEVLRVLDREPDGAGGEDPPAGE